MNICIKSGESSQDVRLEDCITYARQVVWVGMASEEVYITFS